MRYRDVVRMEERVSDERLRIAVMSELGGAGEMVGFMTAILVDEEVLL